MKRDEARKARYEAKLHERKNLMNIHVSKDLKARLNIKKRALLANKGDSVKVMRGSNRGKSAKIAKVNYKKLVVYLEGISRKNAKGTEVLIPFQPSNLMLTDLNMTEARKKEFGNVAPAAAKPAAVPASAPKAAAPAKSQ